MVEQDIIKARESLRNALGDRFSDYMQSMKKWFSGKEFDREAREIVTDNYVHLHNEFLLCIITKCNNFTSTATDAARKTIMPLMPTKSTGPCSATTAKSKKKIKTGEFVSGGGGGSNSRPNSYIMRFVPVDPIKHAPSIASASMEAAYMASNQEFSLDFCARERTLPYAKMIHNRMLLGAIDHNLQQVDIKAVFLLAEATVWLLKNIITKLSSRSKFKQSLRSQCALDETAREFSTSDEKLHLKSCFRHQSQSAGVETFELDKDLFKKLRAEFEPGVEIEDESRSELQPGSSAGQDLKNREDLRKLVATGESSRKLSTTLFDLKNLLQCNKALMPSHSIYTINMEKIACNMWHESEIELDSMNVNFE